MNKTLNITISTRPREINIRQPLEPEWTTARKAWECGWSFHIGLFSAMFCILTIYSIYGIYRSRNRKERVTRNLSYIIHALIAFLGITRVLTLTIFPYEFVSPLLNRPLPVVVARLTFGLGFPCITASFALVQFSFTEALKGKLSASKLRNFAFLAIVISLHFFIVLAVDVITSNVSDTTAVLFLVTKSYFLIMTLATMTRIIYSGTKVLLQARQTSKALKKLNKRYGSTMLSAKGHRQGDPDTDMDKGLHKVRVVIALTCIFCCIISGVEMFSMVELALVLAGKRGALSPWPWYVYQTVFRVGELGLAATILYAITPQENSLQQVASGLTNWIIRVVFCQKETKEPSPVADTDSYTMAINKAYSRDHEDY